MKMIPLTRGKHAIVDDEDYDYLAQWKWSAACLTGKFYAMRSGGILMHRDITNAPKGMDVDHRDGDGLNNCRGNLRVCTHMQNQRNRKLNSNSTTGYKGVTKRWNKYRAQIFVNGRRIIIGHFDDPMEAAKAYDEKAKELYGEFANTNL